MKIDLHRIKHEHVRRIVEQALFNHRIEDDLDIVTGHSKDMQDLVISILNENNIEYLIGGYLGIEQSYIKII